MDDLSAILSFCLDIMKNFIAVLYNTFLGQVIIGALIISLILSIVVLSIFKRMDRRY